MPVNVSLIDFKFDRYMGTETAKNYSSDVVLIDPEGYAVWGTSGEITCEQVDAILKRAMPF